MMLICVHHGQNTVIRMTVTQMIIPIARITLRTVKTLSVIGDIVRK